MVTAVRASGSQSVEQTGPWYFVPTVAFVWEALFFSVRIAGSFLFKFPSIIDLCLTFLFTLGRIPYYFFPFKKIWILEEGREKNINVREKRR